jgi:hypothetical protein
MSGILPLQQAFYQYLTVNCAISTTKIAWPNINFTTPTTGLWYIPSFLPGIPSAAALGVDAPNRHVGLFQVIVCAASGQGEGAAVTEAERLVSLLKRGTLITQNGVVGTIRRAYRTQGFPSTEPECWQVPVREEYWADVAN